MANLGAHLAGQGRLTEAIDWTERAWDGGNVTAGFNLGTFYTQAGDTHRADLVWTKAAQLGDPDAMMCVARLALQRGDRAVADRWLPHVLGQGQPYPITALGVAYRDSGDTVTALRVFDRAIALDDAYAMEYAARIHDRNGDTNLAARLREQAARSTRFGWGLVQLPEPSPPPQPWPSTTDRRTPEAGVAGTLVGILVLAIADGGPGTGNGVVGGYAGVLFGLIAVLLGGLALLRSRHHV
jgi:hypothetical protein